ncbi:hypothetical protein CC80DRAFT_487272 [Byssothecium circinans]|uniref:Ankyrin n=1 Tax=Byssothecium circinans TaxID=147558 RepID=A0A6A5UDN1_9PLEO|nr:hypothetical protein CC80DRAFT_487272 [Byssothecium circinans]
MSDKPQIPPADVGSTLPSTATLPKTSTPSPPPALPAQENPDNEPRIPKPTHLKSPFFREPFRNHPASTIVSIIRAAIEAGGDVNGLDDDPYLGFNEGRPLDACLNFPHMCGDADPVDNLPVIELLLEHGADPRLKSRSTIFPPIYRARYYAGRELPEEVRVFWDRVLALFEEAIVRLEGKEKEEKAGKEVEV